MNGYTFLSRMISFCRAGYPADAPRLGHVALMAMCPAAHSAARSSAVNRNGVA
ncbi:hypothetical protein [Mycobacterium sp. 852013-50091_SCH5140682]|uniref:hypothetical protein n=1 Tax=Mycobacterium sp. 852013-50091_SCH5140682 TaxID=1834109 RepID=UPI000A8015DC|nr:hypothetical protein [Mycobacterium sp. 852013-50091_SCH5140682]